MHRFVLLFGTALLAAAPAFALPPPPEVPDYLRPWTAWALHDHPDLLCTAMGSGRACDWPGHLQLRVDKDGGSFALDVWLDAPAVIALPGDAQNWPQNVAVDDAAAVVQAESSHAFVRLPAGHHKVAGNFAWAETPEILALPKEIGAVELTLLGSKVDVPKRDESGRLLLQKDNAAAAETDSLTVTVSRRLSDGVPLRMTTRLLVRASGKARDVVLGKVLPDGFRPIALGGGLPLQIGGDGALRAHLRPGTFTADIEAVCPDNLATVVVPALGGEFFDKTETWVWVPDETLRSVELSGLASVDPERTQLDAEWKKGRTFLGEAAQTLALKVSRRGETEPAPNNLSLRRQWWLDIDGLGLTSRDELSGDMHQGWRLASQGGWALGRAAVNDRDQLITASADAKNGSDAKTGNGIELRNGNVKVQADLRLADHRGPIAAVGWQADVQSLHTTLHLPPGWTLLGADGVDKLPTTWTDSWTLLDFFFVLMLGLGFGKLLGKGWGALTIATLVVCHGESEAPSGIWLAALLGLGLLAALPESKFRKAVAIGYGLILVALVADAVPFCARQIRHGIYPQIALSDRPLLGNFATRSADVEGDMGAARAPASPAPAAVPDEAVQLKEQANDMPVQAEAPAAKSANGKFPKQAEAERKPAAGKTRGWGISSYSYGPDDSKQLQQMDPHAVVQTGPGVPEWQWSQWQLQWNGPVRADHQISLYLLSPAQNLLLAILRAVCVLLLALRLVDVRRLRRLAAALQAGGPTAVVLLAALLTFGPATAQAQTAPSPELLGQLRDRLNDAQKCEGPCLVVAQMKLAVDGNRFTVTADVSAQRPAALTIPGPLDALQVQQVALDGKPTWELRRDDQGLLRLRVPAGHHVVQVTGNLARRNVIDVQLGSEELPKSLRFEGKSWSVDGIDSNGVPQQSLQLTRRETALPAAASPADLAAAPSASDAAAELPPWYSVHRQLLLGLPWQIRTVVRRQNAERPQIVKVALLAGQDVLTDGVKVEEIQPGKPEMGRRAVVAFARGESEVQFDGQLPLPTGSQAQIALKAPAGEPWTETWQLQCSPVWRCAWTGIAPMHTRDAADNELRPQWQPWPGETVTVQVARPAGAAGQSITVDRVHYTAEPGQRLLKATLEFAVRTSQGGTQKITLPQGAEVQTVTVGGAAKNLRPAGQILQIPLNPGAQTVVVVWQQPWDRQLHETMPVVDLGSPAANLQLSLQPGNDRWLLWAHGPKWGAAVLFWSQLGLVLLLALALARIPGPPLRFRHWLLLGLGLAPLPVPLFLLVVGWLVAMAWRRRYGIHGHDGAGTLWPPVGHNFMQIALFGWGLAALGTLYGAIHSNLLLELDMQVQGANSSEHCLNWLADRTEAALPGAGVYTLPLWVWRGLMLLWALWLVSALLRWLPWAWQGLMAGKGWLPMTQPRLPPAPPPGYGDHPPPPTPPPPGRAPMG